MIFRLPFQRMNCMETPRQLKVRQALSKCLDKKPIAKGSTYPRSEYGKISKLIRPCTTHVVKGQLSISMHQYTNQRTLQEVKKKQQNLQCPPYNITIKDKIKLCKLNCLCYNSAIS